MTQRRAVRLTERDALDHLIKAWESLPDGNHSPRTIESWLRGKMKPAVDAGRAALQASTNDGGEK